MHILAPINIESDSDMNGAKDSKALVVLQCRLAAINTDMKTKGLRHDHMQWGYQHNVYLISW